VNSWIVLATFFSAGGGADDGATGRLPLKEALGVLRREYRPLLVIYLDEKPEGDFVREMKESLEDPEVRKALRSYVISDLSVEALAAPYPAAPASTPGEASPPPGAAAGAPAPAAGKPASKKADRKEKNDPKRVRPEPPPPGPSKASAPAPAVPVGDRLGIVKGVASLVVLDFRERVVRRYQEKAPRRPALVKELRKIAAEIARQAESARKVERILEKAEYSYTLGETREAVLLVLPLDDPKVRQGLDPVLADRLASTLGRYRNDGASAMAAGEALESDNRFLEAVEAYRLAGVRFPFPEIMKASARKQASAMRKARGGV
jgi:hypothetical protein